MSLTVVSTPIGNYGDITLRAKETLASADVIICEELKPARVLLKRLSISEKELYQLNEHSKPNDLIELVTLCRTRRVALISDCGTPGFCDPGADLVKRCVTENIEVDVNPGPSSLMTLLSLSGENLKSFHFVGFLPAERNERLKEIQKLGASKDPLFIMDTPYRLKSTLQDLEGQDWGKKRGILGVDLTGPQHKVFRGTIKELASRDWEKLPFVLLVLP